MLMVIVIVMVEVHDNSVDDDRVSASNADGGADRR